MAHPGGRLTERQKAYIAGIIDGEGCLYLGKRSDGKNGFWYCDALTVEMGCESVPRYLYELCGGLLTSRYRKNRVREMWQWKATNSGVASLLKKIFPYLIEKKKEAMIYIQFRKEIGKRLGRLHTPLTEKEKSVRDSLISKLRDSRKIYDKKI
jgi:hypothetical protein